MVIAELIWLLLMWAVIGLPFALIGGLIAPRKGVDPRMAMAACFVTALIGVIYLVAMPDVRQHWE